MSRLKEKVGERVQRRLPNRLPGWPLGLAWHALRMPRLTPDVGSAG